MAAHPDYLDFNGDPQFLPDDLTSEMTSNLGDKFSMVDPGLRRSSRNVMQLCQPLVQIPLTENPFSDTTIILHQPTVTSQLQCERKFVFSECDKKNIEQCSSSNYDKDVLYESNTQQPVTAGLMQRAAGDFQWPVLSCESVSDLPVYDDISEGVSEDLTPACAASDWCCTGMDSVKPDWSLLPSLAVANILSYLRLRDRYMAAVTCRAWLAALCCPEVWRSCELHIQRSTAERLLTLAQKVGRHVCRLTLYVTQYCGGRHSCAAAGRGGRNPWCAQLQSRSAAHALGALRTGGVCRLLNLRVCGLRRFAEWRDGRATNRVICALARFLHGQTRLQMLQLRDAALASENALWLVRAAAYRCAATLSDVRLDGALGAALDTVSLTLVPFPMPHTALHPLRALKQLSLSPCQLSDQLLGALPAQLQLLVLVARREDPPDPCLVSAASWTGVTRRLPMLSLELVLVGVVTVRGLCSLVPEDGAPAPVRVLRLRGRPPGAAPATATLLASELATGLRLAAVCFCGTLSELDVRAAWLRGGPPLDSFLLEMAGALPRLRVLAFHGPVRRPEEVAAKSGVEKVWLRREKWAWQRR